MKVQRWMERLASRGSDGATLVEYVVLVAVLASMIVGAISVLGAQLSEMYGAVLP